MAAPYTQADVTSGFGLNTALNAETTKIETAFTTVLSKDSAVDNTMFVDLDMGGNNILNVGTLDIVGITFDVSNVTGAVSLADANANYVNVTGDTMTGHLNVLTPTLAAHPARKDQLDALTTTVNTKVTSVASGDGVVINSVDPINPVVSSTFAATSTDTSYTLGAAQNNQWMDITGTAIVNITCPPESTINLGSKFVHAVTNYGSGTLTFVAGTGVTLQVPPGGSAVVPQYATVGVKKSAAAANTYILFGPTVAAV